MKRRLLIVRFSILNSKTDQRKRVNIILAEKEF